MKRFFLLLVSCLVLSAFTRVNAQVLVCNDLVMVALDATCSHSIVPDEVLEGTLFDNCVVEIDKVPPLGNGPWVPANLEAADVGQTYQFRCRHLPSGNSCWGNVKVEDKLAPTLECTGLSVVDIAGGTSTTVTANDLAVSATDACSQNNVTLSAIGNPNIFQFDCSNLGINIVGVSASDQSGNISTCMTTVLVTNSTGECHTCVTNCPASQSVTFDVGYNNLLPAFQAGDWTPFDAYGAPAFSGNCGATDSSYAVTFLTGIAGQSWFERTWEWLDNSGNLIENCSQYITFTSTRDITVHGTIFLDNTPNCIEDAGESGVALFPVIVTKFPAGATETYLPDQNGEYSLTIHFKITDSLSVVNLQLPNGITSACPSALSIPYGSVPTDFEFNIGIQNDGLCPIMQGSMSAVTTRRCFSNYYNVQYCNVGLDTAFGAYAVVHLDSLMSLEGASIPYSINGGNTYTFPLGDVPPLHCNAFTLYAYLSCSATSGQTVCTRLNVYPSTPCAGGWSGAELTARAACEGDSVRLSLINKGPVAMPSELNFIVIEDFIMRQAGGFQLGSGDSLNVRVPANGSTWRIESPQVTGYPVQGIVSAALEGCGGLNTPGAILAFTQGDNSSYEDVDCNVVTGSYDPNDKSAVPSGVGPNHLIRNNEMVEYKIRFQNTGTDTAFQVVVVDTLSSNLDPWSIETGASSHPYRLETFAGGILHFVFDRILLPDSVHNEAASHGFVQFHVAQKPDLPDGVQINNTATIYFDYNEPVITNTVKLTIGMPYELSAVYTPLAAGASVAVRPNPFHDQALIEVSGQELKHGGLQIMDLNGRVVQSVAFTGRQVLIDQPLSPGAYLFRITENGQLWCSGKLITH